MGDSENLIASISNVVDVVNNSITMLRDFDGLLAREGFKPVHSGIGAEATKDLKIKPSQMRAFFPNYMSRYYYNHAKLERGEHDKAILGVNIQFHHPNHQNLTPSIVAAVILCNEHFARKPKMVAYWWIKYAAYEQLPDELVEPNGMLHDRGECIKGHHFTLWGYPLLSIKTTVTLNEQIVQRLLSLYRQIES